MCYNRIYSEVRADGTKETWSEPEICPEKCLQFSQLHYPTKHRERSSSRGPSYSRSQFPPTPPLSYHSDYTSDSERSSRRRSGIYVNDHKVLEINGKRHSRHERQHSGERSSYLGSSPLSRTPALYHHSRPSSPAIDLHDTYEPEYRSRPSSSHSRSSRSGPHVTVEIINEKSKSHRRHGSSSKTSSRESNDEERRHRRASLQHGDQLRLSKKESEIARQNREIKDRTPIPQGPSSSSGYRRGSVSVTPTLSVTERLRLDEERAERRRQKALREEEKRERDAQQQRLKDRFAPKRSNTVSYDGRPKYYY